MTLAANNTIIVDDATIDSIFLHDDVKNRKIAIISIVGALRRGKSFFLDYCLRFMYANVSSSVKVFCNNIIASLTYFTVQINKLSQQSVEQHEWLAWNSG